MHKILVIRLYFPLDALHISDYVSPSYTPYVKLFLDVPVYMYSLCLFDINQFNIELTVSETCRASNGK
jgi:hypothetical protein